MSPRALVVIQMILIEFLAAAFREGPRAVFPENLARPAACLATALLFPLWFGFPILMYRSVRRSDLPAWKCWIVAGVEVGLGYVVWLALAPAVS